MLVSEYEFSCSGGRTLNKAQPCKVQGNYAVEANIFSDTKIPHCKFYISSLQARSPTSNALTKEISIGILWAQSKIPAKG